MEAYFQQYDIRVELIRSSGRTGQVAKYRVEPTAKLVTEMVL